MIKDEATLKHHLPNILPSVRGEVPLFDKIKADIDIAEDWLVEAFTSLKTFNTICGYAEDNPIRIICAKLVTAEAMRRAIPSLDMVLTPNGFGVVSTQNIAPASKQRVDRLIGAMLAFRDDCIAKLLPRLVGASQWINSAQAAFFRESLFPDLSICDEVTGNGSKWERYLELRIRAIDIEDSLAEEFLSPELVDSLRSQNHLGKFRSYLCKSVTDNIKRQVLACLKGEAISTRRMMDIVNCIREHYEDFPEWHGTATAKLFSPPKFENTKSAKGYWF